MTSERVSKLPLAHGDAIDLSHHISDIGKARLNSPLKGLEKYIGQPNLVNLAGGLPSPAYFPFESLKADTLAFDSYATAPGSQGAAQLASSTTKGINSQNNFSWPWSLFTPGKPTVPINIPKFPSSPTDLNLASALQYSTAKGIPQLNAFIQTFTAAVYRPAYANWATLMHVGNTIGFHNAVVTLCNPGEGILMSEWTYTSALFTALPYGVKPVPVGMDAHGMNAAALREVLRGWDVQARGGMPRPHVIYIVPVGQNPTGATMLAERKKEIYEICVEYDIIIIEDDPYYFLQEGEYKLPSERALTEAASKTKAPQPSSTNNGGTLPAEDEEYLNTLVPSFLAFDTQGRVIRLDTFSKTIAPGSRLGWFTCNPVFAERLERMAETSSQAPCGLAQSMITQLLTTWGHSGYIRWLRGLGAEYTDRRNFFLDCIVERFTVVRAPEGHTARFAGSNLYLAYDKEAPTPSASRELSDKTGVGDPRPAKAHLFSFVPPTSGMFVWLLLNFEGHPKLGDEGQQSLEMKLWVKLVEAGLLVAPGEVFSSVSSPPQKLPGHFRMSFSLNPYDEFKQAMDIFATELKKFNEEQ